MERLLRITMIGTGYVGLVSGACLANFFHDVTCVDKNVEKIASLKAGKIPIYEPGLEELVDAKVRSGRLSFSTDLATSVPDSDVVFIAVGTPERRGSGHADLSYIFAAAKEIAQNLSGYTVIVNKSTVPVGTGDEVERIIRETNPDADFTVVSNPEFLREGNAIGDFSKPDRIVVGIDGDHRAQKAMKEVYDNIKSVEFTDRRSAEMIKYASNAFLAVKIAYINEMADLCEAAGANVEDVSRCMGLDPRIGADFLRPGPGYGGSCFPKDTKALLQTGVDMGVDLQIVHAAVGANADRKDAMGERALALLGENPADKTIAVLGLTFKANTDDLRDSSAIEIVSRLQIAGVSVRVFDPQAGEEAKRLFEGVSFAEDTYAALKDADAAVIVTEWNEFRDLDLDRVRTLMKSPVILDLRNLFHPMNMLEYGFRYESIGRPGLRN